MARPPASWAPCQPVNAVAAPAKAEAQLKEGRDKARLAFTLAQQLRSSGDCLLHAEEWQAWRRSGDYYGVPVLACAVEFVCKNVAHDVEKAEGAVQRGEPIHVDGLNSFSVSQVCHHGGKEEGIEEAMDLEEPESDGDISIHFDSFVLSLGMDFMQLMSKLALQEQQCKVQLQRLEQAVEAACSAFPEVASAEAMSQQELMTALRTVSQQLHGIRHTMRDLGQNQRDSLPDAKARGQGHGVHRQLVAAAAEVEEQCVQHLQPLQQPSQLQQQQTSPAQPKPQHIPGCSSDVGMEHQPAQVPADAAPGRVWAGAGPALQHEGPAAPSNSVLAGPIGVSSRGMPADGHQAVLQGELAALQQQLRQAHEREYAALAASQEREAQLVQEQQALRRSLAAWERQCEGRQAEVQAHGHCLKCLTDVAAKYGNKAMQLEEEVHQERCKRAELEVLVRRLKATNGDVFGLMVQLQDMEQELAEAQQERDDALNHSDRFFNHLVSQLSCERHELRQQLEALQAAQVEGALETAALQGRIEGLMQEVELTHAEVEVQRQACAGQRRRARQWMMRVAPLKVQLAHVQELLQGAQQRVADLEAQKAAVPAQCHGNAPLEASRQVAVVQPQPGSWAGSEGAGVAPLSGVLLPGELLILYEQQVQRNVDVIQQCRAWQSQAEEKEEQLDEALSMIQEQQHTIAQLQRQHPVAQPLLAHPSAPATTSTRLRKQVPAGHPAGRGLPFVEQQPHAEQHSRQTTKRRPGRGKKRKEKKKLAKIAASVQQS